MDIDALLETLDQPPRLKLSPDELAGLLDKAELVREEDTCISGMIRILRLKNTVLVQEQTPDHEIVVRIRPTVEAEEEFVARASSLRFSPAFVARAARCRAQWVFRSEGRGVVLDSTSSTPK